MVNGVQINPWVEASRYSTTIAGSTFSPAFATKVTSGLEHGMYSTGTTLFLSVDRLSQLGVSADKVQLTVPLTQRNGATPLEHQLHEQYTSNANRSYLSSRAVTGANFEIGPVVDGATLRGLTIGGRTTTASAITPWLTFDNAGAATFSGALQLGNAAAAATPTATHTLTIKDSTGTTYRILAVI